MTSKKEQLEFDLLLNITNAMTSLNSMDKNSKEFGVKFSGMLKEIQTLADSLGQSFSEVGIKVAGAFNGDFAKKFEAELSALDLQTKQLLADVSALDARSASANNMLFSPAQPKVASAGSSMLFSPRDVDPDLIPKKLSLLEQLKQKLFGVEDAAKKAGGGFNILRSAMGFLTAMGMSAILQSIIGFFSKALELAKGFRGQLAQLNFAEAVLSKKGMDITREELDKFVSEIEAKYKYLSAMDATSIVSTVASMGAEFNLSKDKILELSDAVAFLQLQERAYGMEVSQTGSIVNAALDGRSNYFNKLGINITKTAIKAKAFEMGLIESGAAITKEQSNQAAIALLIEQTSGKYDELIASIEKTNPALAKQMAAEKMSADATRIFGEQLVTLTDAWNGFLLSFQGTDANGKKFDNVTKSAKILAQTLGFIAFLVASVWKVMMGAAGVIAAAWIPVILIFKGITDTLSALLAGDFVAAGKALVYPMQNVGRLMKEAFLNGWNMGGDPTQFLKLSQSVNTATNTPTGDAGLDDLAQAEEDAGDKRQEALDKYAKELAETEIKAAQEREDIAIDLGRTLVDIEEEYDRKRADLARDYQNKIRDINLQYEQDVADIKIKQYEDEQKRRNDDTKREEEYQNKLLELKENYLMSLEDALHSRDARQVLKLMRQYELDKLQLARRHELDEQQAEREARLARRSIELELKKAKMKRDIALAAAAQEQKDKLAQLAIDEKREEEDAKLKAQRKLEDLAKANADKMALLAASLIQEYNLTGDWMVKMVNLYQTYYRNIARVYEALARLRQTAAQAQMSSSGGSGGSTPSGSNPGMSPAPPPLTSTYGFAGGGISRNLPATRIGKTTSSSFAGTSVGGSGGKVSIELLLSPDLESRIVANSLDQTAEIVTRIQRGK